MSLPLPMMVPVQDLYAESTLKLENLSISYQQQYIFSAVSLSLQYGQIYCLSGENGAGKTTFMKALAGQLGYTGKICRGQVDLSALIESGAVVYVAVDPALPDDLSVKEYLLFMAAGWRLNHQLVLKLATELGLAPWYDFWPSKLSRGTRQKVALVAAVSIAQNTAGVLLILDEPLNTLDANSRKVMLQALGQVKSSNGLVILSSHEQELSGFYDQRIEIADQNMKLVF